MVNADLNVRNKLTPQRLHINYRQIVQEKPILFIRKKTNLNLPFIS